MTCEQVTAKIRDVAGFGQCSRADLVAIANHARVCPRCHAELKRIDAELNAGATPEYLADVQAGADAIVESIRADPELQPPPTRPPTCAPNDGP
jgi:anti-sigma factor ChrR (cupin superfamily)